MRPSPWVRTSTHPKFGKSNANPGRTKPESSKCVITDTKITKSKTAKTLSKLNYLNYTKLLHSRHADVFLDIQGATHNYKSSDMSAVTRIAMTGIGMFHGLMSLMSSAPEPQHLDLLLSPCSFCSWIEFGQSVNQCTGNVHKSADISIVFFHSLLCQP